MDNKLTILNSYWTKLFFGLVIFAVSVGAYFYPIYQKGYPLNAGFINLSQARNFATLGTYNYESSDGVLLASENVRSEGKSSALLNPLTSIIYGYIFKFVGVENLNLSVFIWVGIVLAALFNTIIFFLIAHLFGLAIGFVSAMVIVLLPLRVVGAISFVADEFAMLFFAIALLLYLGSKKGPFGSGSVRLVLFSVFFALTTLARNAFLSSFVPFVLFDFYKHRSYKRIFLMLMPFLLIFGSTLTPFSWLGVPNGYLADFDSQPFGQIGHVFSDPYSAYYNKDNVLKQIGEQEGLKRLQTHYLKQWGYDVGLVDRISAYKTSVIFYLKETVNFTNLGGPLVIFFMILGFHWLFRNKKDVFWFFAVWLVVWFLGLVYFETSNRSHYLQTILIWGSLTGLGIYQLWKWIELDFAKKFAVGLLLVFLTIGHLAYADWWKLFDAYRSVDTRDILELSQNLARFENQGGRVAAGINQGFAGGLNYLSRRDVVYFDSDNVEKLIKTNKLKEAFEIYEVKIAVGFPDSFTEDIEKMTGVKVIPRVDYKK